MDPRGPSEDTALARLDAVSKRYGGLQALDRLDLVVQPGEVVALLGPNGAGKTTALGLLTGRLQPDSGSVHLFGGDPRDAARRRGLGCMLQQTELPDTLRVIELVRQFAGYYPQPLPVEQTLERCGLARFAQRYYSALSGGEKRRVQFALAICGDPPLLIVDEPTTGLDVEARRGFWQVLRELRSAGTAIVLTTHYLEEADALADRVVLLAEGRVLAEDTPRGIKARASAKQVRCRSRIQREELLRWPEAEGLQAAGEDAAILEFRSARPEPLLARLLQADPELSELEVLPLSLEEAFVQLTAAGHRLPATPSITGAAA